MIAYLKRLVLGALKRGNGAPCIGTRRRLDDSFSLMDGDAPHGGGEPPRQKLKTSNKSAGEGKSTGMTTSNLPFLTKAGSRRAP
jgi:hypothetical protein